MPACVKVGLLEKALPVSPLNENGPVRSRRIVHSNLLGIASFLLAWNVCTARTPSDLTSLGNPAFFHLPSDPVSQMQPFRLPTTHSVRAQTLLMNEDRERKVLLLNGTADDSFTFSFFPETGRNMSDYVVRVQSSDIDVLNNFTDIELAYAESNRGVNVTASLDFHLFSGNATLSFEVLWKDESLYDSLTVNYLVAGLVVYTVGQDGKRSLVSGSNRSFVVEDYSNVFLHDQYVLKVFVQYLNGSTSASILSDGQGDYGSPVVRLEDIEPAFVDYRGQFDWDVDICRLSDAMWDGATLTMRDGCGLCILRSQSGNSGGTGLLLGIKFERYRAGKFVIVLFWTGFTEGSEFEDLEYVTYMSVHIGGIPPVVVRLISPANMFSADGGQDLYVEMLNANNASIESFAVDGVEKPFLARPGSYQQFLGPSDFYESVVFVTEPGRGKNLQWTIQGYKYAEMSDPVIGDPGRQPLRILDLTGFLFSYDDPEVTLDGMHPLIVREEGGDLVTLFGSFHDFNVSDVTHSVLLSGIVLQMEHMQSWNDTHIVFEAPPRLSVGSSWTYNVGLRTGVMLTRSFRLTYVSSFLLVRLAVFGGSFDVTNNRFVFGACSRITILATHHIMENIEVSVKWRLLDRSNDDILPKMNASDINTKSMMFAMPAEMLPEVDKEYRIAVEMSTPFAVGGAEITLLRSPDFVLGVSVVDMFDRSVGVPSVALRAFVKIEVPRCINDSFALRYDWSFKYDADILKEELPPELSAANNYSLGDPYQFSLRYIPHQVSHLRRDKPGIARLGREMVIPVSFLRWGTHRVSCLVTAVNSSNNWTEVIQQQTNRSIQGFATATVHVFKSSLLSVIRHGEDNLLTNGGRDIQMFGWNSRDPDELRNEPSSGLSYRWDCKQSYFESLSHADPCSADIMQQHVPVSPSFTISSKALSDVRSAAPIGTVSVYLQFSLLVSKDTRTAISYFVIEVTCEPELPATPNTEYGFELMYAGIKFQYGSGGIADLSDVKFWEDIIIEPLIHPKYRENTTWRFEVIEPSHERNRLFVDGKMFKTSHYYPATACGCGEFHAFPLGILAGALAPHSVYRFKLQILHLSGSGARKESMVWFHFRTKEMPRLVHQVSGGQSGDLTTVFCSHSLVSTADASSYVFQHFYIDGNRQVEEQCLDGCTGGHIAMYRANAVGLFTLQVKLFSVDGSKLLDMWNSSEVIQVTSQETHSLMDYHRELMVDFLTGDDGSIVHRGDVLASSMINPSLIGIHSISTDVLDEFCEDYLPLWVNATHDIASRLLPVSEHVRYNIRVASNYARLKCLESESTLYGLLRIVDKSIALCPREISLRSQLLSSEYMEWRNVSVDFDIVDDLAYFYNCSITRGISAEIGSGSTRSRLSPIEGYTSNLIIDLFERFKVHVVLVSSSHQTCGWTQTVPSGLESGVGESELGSNEDGVHNTLGISQIHVALRCREQDGASIEGLYSMFRWCSTVYDLSSFIQNEYDVSGSQKERTLMSLYEVYDYVYLSGIQGQNRTDSKRLVDIDVTRLDDSMNRLTPVTDVETGTFAPSEKPCFQLGMQMDDIASQQLLLERSILQSRLGRSNAVASKTSSDNTSSSGILDSCKFNAFALWPLKEYGSDFIKPFQGDAYLRRDSDIHEVDELSNGSYVTIRTDYVGLFGAVRLSCLQGLQADSADVAGILLSLAALIICILLLLLIVTTLTYLLATTIVAGNEESDYETPLVEYFVERDVYGRGHAHLEQPPAPQNEEHPDDSAGNMSHDALHDSERPVEESTAETSSPQTGEDKAGPSATDTA